MAKYEDITFDVSSPIPEGECTAYYFVEYRVIGDAGYTLLDGHGITIDNPVRLMPLAPDTEYEYRITRHCCNGLVSDATIGTFITDPA